MILSRRLLKTFYRFVQFIKFNGECWEWTGARSGAGNLYGQFRDETQKRVQSHRFSYEFFVGPIPSGMNIDHLCRNEACVNPRHLEPVTHQENILRGKATKPCIHGRRAKTHCNTCIAEASRIRARNWYYAQKAKGVPA